MGVPLHFCNKNFAYIPYFLSEHAYVVWLPRILFLDHARFSVKRSNLLVYAF